MSYSKNIYLLGYSGHAYVVIDIALSNDYGVKGYFDFFEAKNNPYNLNFLGSETKVDTKLIVKSDIVFPAIGSNKIRKRAIEFIEKNNFSQVYIIDKTASVSLLATINVSSMVGSKAIVNSMSTIGKGCIINSGAIIEHECVIDNFTHVAPGAVLAGNVKVGQNVFIGAGAIIKQGITIGDNAIIGAGAIVIRDVPSNETWVGNPARRI